MQTEAIETPVVKSATINIGDHDDDTVQSEATVTFAMESAGTPPETLIPEELQFVAVDWSSTYWALLWCLFLDVALFALLLTALTVPISSYQIIQTECNSIADPPLPNKLYYNLWQGVGTTPECKQTDTDYCIKWSNNKAWSYIDTFSGSNMAYDRNYFTAAQVLLVLATIFTFFALINHVGVMSSSTRAVNAQAVLADLADSSGGGTMMFVWAMVLISVTLLLYNDQMRGSYWQIMWTNGFNIPNILHQTVPGPISLTGACRPQVIVSDGVIVASTATALAFAAGVIFITIICIQLPRGY